MKLDKQIVERLEQAKYLFDDGFYQPAAVVACVARNLPVLVELPRVATDLRDLCQPTPIHEIPYQLTHRIKLTMKVCKPLDRDLGIRQIHWVSRKCVFHRSQHSACADQFSR